VTHSLLHSTTEDCPTLCVRFCQRWRTAAMYTSIELVSCTVIQRCVLQWRMELLFITPCNVARSSHWFRQMTATCNVVCGCKIVTVNSLCGSTLQCGWWLWDDMPWNSPKRLPYIGILHIVSILTTSPQSTCNCAPVSEILSKSDHSQQKKWRNVDFHNNPWTKRLFALFFVTVEQVM